MKTGISKLIALAIVAMVTTLAGPVSAQTNMNTTLQEGGINTNDSFQRGDSNDNATYQEGEDNANRTRQRGSENFNATGQFGDSNYNETDQREIAQGHKPKKRKGKNKH
jgi:minor curlin subunit